MRGILFESVAKGPACSGRAAIVGATQWGLACQVKGLFWVHFTWVHRYDFITGKRADIRRGDSWGWGFFHERLIRPYIYVDETIGIGNKKQTRPIVVRCPQRRSLVGRIRRLSNVINSHCPRAEYPPVETPHFPRYHDEHILH